MEKFNKLPQVIKSLNEISNNLYLIPNDKIEKRNLKDKLILKRKKELIEVVTKIKKLEEKKDKLILSINDNNTKTKNKSYKNILSKINFYKTQKTQIEEKYKNILFAIDNYNTNYYSLIDIEIINSTLHNCIGFLGSYTVKYGYNERTDLLKTRAWTLIESIENIQ